MKYKAGYKYQLHKDESFKIPIQPGAPKDGASIFSCGPFLRLAQDGTVTIKSGYSWDGCSGPTWDDKTNMRAGLYHDALYQFIRNKVLPEDPFREMADQILKDTCKADGMNSIRAYYYHLAVRKFGGAAVQKPKDVLEAP